MRRPREKAMQIYAVDILIPECREGRWSPIILAIVSSIDEC
jgi:hypothetical protein